MVAPARRRHASGGFRAQRCGSSRDGASLPLFDTLVDTQSLVGGRDRDLPRLHVDQPDALQKIKQQQRSRRKLRGAESIGMKTSAQHLTQQSGTECFTMSGTPMDNKPLSPSSAEPEPPLAADDAKAKAPALSSSSLLSSLPSCLPKTGAHRESPLRDA